MVVKKIKKMKDKLKLGQKIVAIDPCVMDETEKPALTIGNDYEIKELRESGFKIYDDKHEEHFFDYHDFDEFFKLKEPQLPKIEIIQDWMRVWEDFESDAVKRFALCKIENAFRMEIICVHYEDEELYFKGERFRTTTFKKAKPIKSLDGQTREIDGRTYRLELVK